MNLHIILIINFHDTCFLMASYLVNEKENELISFELNDIVLCEMEEDF